MNRSSQSRGQSPYSGLEVTSLTHLLPLLPAFWTLGLLYHFLNTPGLPGLCPCGSVCLETPPRFPSLLTLHLVEFSTTTAPCTLHLPLSACFFSRASTTISFIIFFFRVPLPVELKQMRAARSSDFALLFTSLTLSTSTKNSAWPIVGT